MFRALACAGCCDNHARKQHSEIEAAVETILILTEVTVGVFFEVKGMVGPVDGVFQVAQDGVDPGKTSHVGAFAAFADNFTLLETPGLSDRLEAPEAIRNNRRGWNQGSSSPGLDFRGSEPFDFGEHDIQGVVLIVGLCFGVRLGISLFC